MVNPLLISLDRIRNGDYLDSFWLKTGLVGRESQAMELRMQLDNEFIETLQGKLGLRATDIVREGLTILNWAIHERDRGRVILSADPNGQNVVRLAMPVLEKIAMTR